MIDEYRNLDVRLFGSEKSPEGLRFNVQVDDSPIGEQEQAERALLSPALSDRLAALERRELDADEAQLRLIGTAIGELLFPPVARGFLMNSLSRLQGRQGLRIRIKCGDIDLDRVPWEFAHVDLNLGAGSAGGMQGYLVLQSQISLVRNEVFARVLAPVERGPGRKRLLAVLCEPDALKAEGPPLDLDAELANIANALKDCTHIGMDACSPPTRQRLQELLLAGADVFHFAGHGVLREGAAPGGSQAYLVMQREDGSTDEWLADEIALALASKGIQLAMLGACHSAARDGRNGWAGIAPVLVRAGIPAVIGMQFDVYDQSAVDFSRMLYRAWSELPTLDEAMTEARKAILGGLNATGRDFATPVLYLRRREGAAPLLVRPAEEGEFRPAPHPVQEHRAAESRSVAAVLASISELRDYKDAHEALHSARALAFKHIELGKEDFPEPRTLEMFVMHAKHLRQLLDDIQRIRKRGRCDPEMLLAIVEEFTVALGLLNEALALGARSGLDAAAREQAGERLEEALAGFDTLLTLHPAKVDACMTLLAKRIDVDVLLGRPGGAGAGAAPALTPSAAEILLLAGKLQSSAALHHLCQDLDTKMAMIRMTDGRRRFVEIRRQWPPMSASLSKAMVGWEPDVRKALQDSTTLLDTGVATNDEPGVGQVFKTVCADFDFGFFAVDTDFKAVCGEMNDKVIQSLSGGAAGGGGR